MTEKTNEQTNEQLNEQTENAEEFSGQKTPQQEENGDKPNQSSDAEEYIQLLQRVQADFDNFRRRTAQEKADWSKYCSQRLATSLLPILDNFERALQAGGEDLNSFRDGIDLIYRQFKDVLEKDGIRAMETIGSQFDPNYHEAVMQGPSDEYPDNTVIEELQKGYMLADRVLRPAMVKVSRN